MKQITYNTETQKNSRIYAEGYKVDGQPGTVEPPLLLLNVVDNVTLPTYDSATQYITSAYVIDEVNNEYRLEYTVHDYTPEELNMLYLASLNWKQLEDDLETTPLVDTPSETFFERALTTTNTNAYALLMNCFGSNKWDKRLGPALQLVKDSLPTPLTTNELSQLNTILANNGFNITIV